ncbi:MAG: metallophosphoesterase family protein [Ignisphaera sp.]
MHKGKSLGLTIKIAIISDIHGNVDALNAVLESVSRWDYIWFLGDFVDYGPEPHIVVDIVKSLKPDAVVMGNHDNAVALNVDCMCAPEIHELSEYTRRNISLKFLSRDQLEWLKMLPKTAEVDIGNKRFYIVHGSPRNPLYGYMYPYLSLEELKLSLTPSLVSLKPKPVRANVVVVGHTHIPMDIVVDSIKIVNPGSCGQPRDGDNRASYVVYDVETEIVEIRRVKYDVERVIGKLRELRLEDKYFNQLASILRIGRIYI